jgi:recombination protein RecR
MHFAKPLAKLVSAFEQMPGIGVKSAQRLAFYVLKLPQDQAEALSEAILAVKREITQCPTCFNYTDAETCGICADPRRDPSIICVVSDPRDVVAIEKTNEFHGVYHVLCGLISPMDGIGPEALKIAQLLERVQGSEVSEVVIATNPTVEGDTTAMYLAKLLKPIGLKVTQIAHGMPVGGEMDYADQYTLIKAMQWRREM